VGNTKKRTFFSGLVFLGWQADKNPLVVTFKFTIYRYVDSFY
jgi:hypothetical protein